MKLCLGEQGGGEQNLRLMKLLITCAPTATPLLNLTDSQLIGESLVFVTYWRKPSFSTYCQKPIVP